MPLTPLHIEIMLAAHAVCRYHRFKLVWGSQQTGAAHPSYVIYPCEDPNTWHGASHLCRISIPEWGRGGAIELPIAHDQVGFTNGWTPVRVHIGSEASYGVSDIPLYGLIWGVDLRRLGPGPYRTRKSKEFEYRRLLEFRVRGRRYLGPIPR